MLYSYSLFNRRIRGYALLELVAMLDFQVSIRQVRLSWCRCKVRARLPCIVARLSNSGRRLLILVLTVICSFAARLILSTCEDASLRICSTCILPWPRAWGLRGIATVLVLVCIVFVVDARLQSYRSYLMREERVFCCPPACHTENDGLCFALCQFVQRMLMNDFTWTCRAFGTLITDATNILDASH